MYYRYGDIVPSNDLQRVVACVTMLCGTTLFSYIIGAVSELAQNPTGGAVRRSGTMQVRCTRERFINTLSQRTNSHFSIEKRYTCSHSSDIN
jgi:Ion channel